MESISSPLDTITDPHLYAGAVADALSIRPVADQPVLQAVAQHLRPRQVLLVLDNFEQVLDAGTDLLQLIMSCARLKVLVTSREALHVQGEWRFAVQPLSLPDSRILSEHKLEVLAHIPTLDLFTQRAQAIQSDFSLTPDNALQVSEICAQLDGLPLAIELAATRVASLSLGEISSGVGRVKLLRGNMRNLPARQRTVLGAIDWSYELLQPQERALFRRLGVFAGGCTLAAIESVCAAPDLPLPDLPAAELSIVDECQALIEKSLLRRGPGKANGNGEGRYVMLEVLRECALEKLRASGEEQATRRRHAEYYVALVEETRPGLDGAKQGEVLQALEAENDNIRAVLGWSLEGGPETVEIALRLSGALGRFWMVRSYATEGRRWLEQALKAAESVATIRPFVRIRALTAAGGLASDQGDYLAARPLREQALTLAQAEGDKRVIATCLLNLGSALHHMGEHSQATALYEQALAIHREIGNKGGIGIALINMAWAAFIQGDRARSRELY
jgi:predicted ATPase